MKNYTFETNPMRASWRFVRFDDAEIFDADQAYFDRQAKEMADAGFTHVMTFSDTHFRWSFRRDFKLLTEGLRKQVAACHKYGLWVVEHHSANLSWNYETEAQKLRAVNFADPKRWPHFVEDMSADSLYRGVRFRDMQQVSGETGEPFISFFNAYILCHNNPDYVRFYLDYLEEVYATGVDGIMTDDIQFISGMHATGPDNVPYFDMDSCTCAYCRAKFKAQTGCELPAPGAAWHAFTQDQHSELFLKWKRFRYESTLDFHKAVVAHYTKLGLKMMRPNYTATSVAWVSPWAFVFDDLPELDWGFVEHCCGIIRYSWPEYVFESVHCNMLTRQRNIPALSLYYPTEADQQRLSWALSLYCGHRYLGDPRKMHLFAEQKRFHEFENDHFEALFQAQPNIRLAFYDSQLGRELDPEYNETVRFRFNSWAQACIHNNLPWAMVNPQHPEEFARYRTIVVPGTAFLSDAEIANLKTFATDGGTLIWCDNAGSWDLEGPKPRTEAALLQLFGLSQWPTSDGIHLGNGRLIKVNAEMLPGAFTRRCRADGEGNRDAFDCSEPTRWLPLNERQKAEHRAIVNFLAATLPDGGELQLPGAPEGLLASSFTDADGRINLRLANAAGCMKFPALPGFGEKDPVPFEKLSGTLTVRLRKPDACQCRTYSHAELATEQAPARQVPLSDDGKWLQIDLPGETIIDFALIELF